MEKQSLLNYGDIPHWPARQFDYREDGISFRSMPKASIADVPKICAYYENYLKACFKDDKSNAEIVYSYIDRMKSASTKLSDQDQQFEEKLNKVYSIEEEFDILKGGDLDTDPLRTPDQMHKRLLDTELYYNLLADAIASYKRRIAMLEQSLPKHEDPNIY